VCFIVFLSDVVVCAPSLLAHSVVQGQRFVERHLIVDRLDGRRNRRVSKLHLFAAWLALDTADLQSGRSGDGAERKSLLTIRTIIISGEASTNALVA
jgi:hypothetical protein